MQTRFNMGEICLLTVYQLLDTVKKQRIATNTYTVFGTHAVCVRATKIQMVVWDWFILQMVHPGKGKPHHKFEKSFWKIQENWKLRFFQ